MSSVCNTHPVTTTEHPQVYPQIYVIPREWGEVMVEVWEGKAESMGKDH